MEPIEKIAELITWYYKPIQMIEHKYRTKVTAIGLLKSANMNSPAYLQFYIQRLVSYKALIKDHTDNMKLATQVAKKIFIKIISDIFQKNLTVATRTDYLGMQHVVTLIYPKYDHYPEESFDPVLQQFLQKYKSDANIAWLAEMIINNYLKAAGNYDKLADAIVTKCLTGVTQEEVHRRIATALYNFYVYGIYSRTEATEIYNITLQTGNAIIPMKYFTKINSLARAVINKVGNYKSTVNFFGKRWDDVSEINKLFRKNTNIIVMYY